MSTSQPGILAPVPAHSRYIEFGAVNDLDPVAGLNILASRTVGEDVVIGIGLGLVQGLGRSIEGLRPFPSPGGPGCAIPSTQADIWCWIRGTDRGEITHTGRSMPWADASGEGLMFGAFGASLYAYDALLRRMVGKEDGITDGLFRFSHPVSGSYFRCPPVKDGKLDLSALGI